jgi:chorismate synthase
MFRFLTAGESHGECLTLIVEGLPSGLRIEKERIDFDLRRRQGGYGRSERMKIEFDEVEIKSGVRNSVTLGTPITMIIRNKDWGNWKGIMHPFTASEERKITSPRPGHADLAGAIKYLHKDIRNVLERASARETAARVAVGSLAKMLIAVFEIVIASHVTQIGRVRAKVGDKLRDSLKEKISSSSLYCLDEAAEGEMLKLIDRARERGESVGGVFEVVVFNPPIGLGSYVHWDKRLDARLANALMSIPAVKGVEVGLGFRSAERFGSEVHDEIFYTKEKGFYRKTNNAGGVEGGVSNGEPIILRAAMKPIPTLSKALSSIDLRTLKPTPAPYERSDVCAVPAAAVVGEAVVAIEVARAMQEKFGGDSVAEMKRNFENYKELVKEFIGDA